MPYPFYQRRRDGAPAPFGFVPLSAEPPYGAGPDTLSAPIVKVMDNAQPYPRPGFTPVPPDIFREWRKHAERGLTGLIHALRPGGGMGTMGDDPDCEAEWKDAREFCEDMFTPKNRAYSNGVRGGYKTVDDCMRGNVSARCLGNPLVPPLYKRPRGAKPPSD